MTKPKYPLHWPNVLFLTLSPIAAILVACYDIPRNGIHVSEILLFLAMFMATGFSITAGYHRHFAHVSYRAHPLVRIFYLVFGACALQNSALNWASDHRLHHRFTDTESDPYNAGQGFFWSHIGWIFYQSREPKQLLNVGDLIQNRWIQWQHRHHVPIGLIIGFGGPFLIGCAIGHPIGGLLWGALIRVVVVHHVTFFINSLAHMFGNQPYSKSDSSYDSWWLAVLTNGEGYHNFHHRFPSDYRNGIYWYQWDPTKWLIASLKLVGFTYKLQRIPSHIILRTRIEVEAQEAEKHLRLIPTAVGHPLRERLDAARGNLEHALVQWAELKTRYRKLRKETARDWELSKQHWNEQLKDYDYRFHEALLHWRTCLQNVQRLPISS